MGGENEILTWQAKKPMHVVDENAIPTLQTKTPIAYGS
jgi:hypothetical protein